MLKGLSEVKTLRGFNSVELDNDENVNKSLEIIDKELKALEALEKEIGVDITTLFKLLKEKPLYLTYVDGQWCVCDMNTDKILEKEELK